MIGTIRYYKGTRTEPYTMAIPDGAILSVGDALETRARLLCDGTRRPQGLARRVKNTAKTSTLRFDLISAREALEKMPEILDLCARKCIISFNGRAFPAMVCTSAQAAPAIDGANIFASASISLEFTEIYTKRETAQTAVRTFKGRSWENLGISGL